MDFSRGKRVAIVGAGMAGLSCADVLVARGFDVRLFDKGRGAGGRMSTRRIETVLGVASIDHGAQYFTARDAGFLKLVEEWAARGVAQRWPVAGLDAWIGVPGMNAVVRDMVARHDAHFDRTISGLAREARGWRLIGERIEPDLFDVVLLALPAEQTATMLGPVDLQMAGHAVMARSQPCWTAMFAFRERLRTETTVLRNRGLIGWAARNSAKPGRSGPEAWVVQATGAWSSDNLTSDRKAIEITLLSALAVALNIDLDAPIASAAHRWRYAMSAGLGEGALWNSRLGIGACGDWLLGPRVESAWLSGKALADAVSLWAADSASSAQRTTPALLSAAGHKQ